jgi:hypothetical protein
VAETAASNIASSILAYAHWLASIPVSSTTGWRWVRDGRIQPINIAGRLYVTRAEIERFQARAAAGEFAKGPAGAAFHVRKKHKGPK